MLGLRRPPEVRRSAFSHLRRFPPGRRHDAQRTEKTTTAVNVLIVGGGGREHALAWKLQRKDFIGGSGRSALCVIRGAGSGRGRYPTLKMGRNAAGVCGSQVGRDCDRARVWGVRAITSLISRFHTASPSCETAEDRDGQDSEIRSARRPRESFATMSAPALARPKGFTSRPKTCMRRFFQLD